MNRKDRESANTQPLDGKSIDAMVKKMQEKLQKDISSEGSPEDVFGGRSVTAKRKTVADDQLAAFDAYMAQLLGEAIADRRTAPVAPSTTEDEPFEVDDQPEEEQDLIDEGTPEETLEGTDDVPVNEGAETVSPMAFDDEEAAEDTISAPDVRVELSDEMLTDEALTDVADGTNEADEVSDDTDEEQDEELTSDPIEEQDTALETEASENKPPFEVLEQLAIPEENAQEEAESDAVREDIPEWEDVSSEAQEQVLEAEPFDEPIEVSPDRPTYDFSEEVEETADVATEHGIEQDASPAVEQQNAASEADEPQAPQEPQDRSAPMALHEGDILLDAEDEIPAPKQPEPTSEPVKPQQTASAPETTPTPVASPLDAARESHAPKQTAEPPRPKQSPLDAMAARAQGNVTSLGGAPVFGKTQKSEKTLSDDDVELLLDLGYDNDLTQKVGRRRVETVRYRHRDDEQTRRTIARVRGCAGEEYSSHQQDNQIKENYRMHARTATVRMTFSVLLAALMLAADIFPLFRGRLGEAVAHIPTSGEYGAIGMMLLLLSVLVTGPRLLHGWRALVRFSPVPASLPGVLVVFTLIYDMVSLFAPECGLLLNFPTGVALAFLTVADRMTVQRERTTFDVVSAHSRKIVMEPTLPRKKKVVRGGRIVKIVNEEGGQAAWRVRPTDQVAGYFRRNGEGTPRYRSLAVLLTVAVIAALTVGVLTALLGGGLADGAAAYLLTLQLGLPAVAIVSYAYPLLAVSRRLAQDGCAIIGQGAVDEYAGAKTLIFDDTEMFHSKSSIEITIKGSGDTKKYIRYAKRLFYTLGGTLRGISTSDLSAETYEERVEILKIYEQGVEARIDGKVNVMLGTSAHMIKHHIRVPSESAELLVRHNVESSILYLAFDGKLKLGYEVDYRISGRFERMVEALAHQGTTVAVETSDPCIYNDFLTRSRKPGSSPVHVVKPVRFERRSESAICDSGVVATRSARDISLATAACDRLMKNDRQLCGMNLLSALFGAVLSLALCLLGLLSQSVTIIAALVQLVFCLPMIMLCRKNLNNESSENEHVS